MFVGWARSFLRVWSGVSLVVEAVDCWAKAWRLWVPPVEKTGADDAVRS